MPQRPAMPEQISYDRQPSLAPVRQFIFALGIAVQCASGAQIRFPGSIDIFGNYREAILLHNAIGLVLIAFLAIRIICLALAVFSKRRSESADKCLTGVGAARFIRNLFTWPSCCVKGPRPHGLEHGIGRLFCVAVLWPLLGLSGVFLMNIVPLWGWILNFGGLRMLGEIHFLLACLLVAFYFNHQLPLLPRKTPQVGSTCYT